MTTNLVGKMVGGYKLIESIGAGSLAVVYKAHQPNLDRWVAVKVLHFKGKTSLVRFKREAKAIALLRHQNILIVNEYGEDGEWPYIVMECIEGGTLKDRLSGGPLDWVKAVKLIIPIAEALHYAHDQGIVHRDVKPSNILMARVDWPLLADFGMVKLIDSEEELTMVGAVVGTPSYIAPEQARGTEIDHRVDMYALGVILFEMVAGCLPFDYENVHKVLLAHIADPPPSPRLFNPDCPPDLEQVILTTMKKSPDKRYKNMLAMVDALRNILASSEERPTLGPTSSSPALEAGDSVKTFVLDDIVETADLSERPAPNLPQSSIRIFLLEQRKTIHVLDLGKDSLIIGRTHGNTRADIDLVPYNAANSGVSRQHSRLIKQDDEWLIDDLDSLNGTYVNNIKIEPGHPVPLKHGDEIRCSRFSFLFLTSWEIRN